jgi:hypothetical protein
MNDSTHYNFNLFESSNGGIKQENKEMNSKMELFEEKSLSFYWSPNNDPS